MADTQNTELMSIFDFTAEDLEANRSGQMSVRQIEKMGQIIEKADEWLGIMWILGVVGVVVLLLLTSQACSLTLPEAQTSQLSKWILPGVLSFIVVLTILYRYRNYAQLDVNKSRARTTSGITKLFIARHWRRGLSIVTRYYLQCGLHTFEITETTYIQFETYLARTGEKYFIIYYSPFSNKPLSVEQIPH